MPWHVRVPLTFCKCSAWRGGHAMACPYMLSGSVADFKLAVAYRPDTTGGENCL